MHIALVDYNSDAPHATWLSAAAGWYQTTVIQVANVREWNKSHCLNIGIRRCLTRYVMILDADILLAADYLHEAVAELSRDPLQVVMNQILDLAQPDSILPQEFTDSDLLAAKMIGRWPSGAGKVS